MTQKTSERLRAALRELDLMQRDVRITATALCDRAGVSRNTLYKNHRDVLDELAKLNSYRVRDVTVDHVRGAERDVDRLKAENREVQRKLKGMAALVDHYFCAWQEAVGQLARKDRQIELLRRTANERIVPIRK